MIFAACLMGRWDNGTMGRISKGNSSSLTNDIPHPSKVQIKIANLDKGQIQLYQRVLE